MTDLEQFLTMLRRGVLDANIKVERGVDMSAGGPMFPPKGTTVVTIGGEGTGATMSFWFTEEPVELLRIGHREAGGFYGTAVHIGGK